MVGFILLVKLIIYKAICLSNILLRHDGVAVRASPLNNKKIATSASSLNTTYSTLIDLVLYAFLDPRHIHTVAEITIMQKEIDNTHLV